MERVSLLDSNWLGKTQESVATKGFAVLENVLSTEFLSDCKSHMYGVQKQIHDEIGSATLQAAGELGVLRLMFKYDTYFLRLLDLKPVVQIVDSLLSPTSILHLQNGFILPSSQSESIRQDVFQLRFHQDFKRVLGGYRCSLNIFFAIDEFTESNGATLVVPGSHQKQMQPSEEECREKAVPVVCPAGSLIVFDSTLWHAAGYNTSGADRLAINQQFTHSYFKQQIDYCRALSKDVIQSLPLRSQQLLGWYTRVPTSLQEYYVAPEDRLYRGGQG